MRTLLLIIVMVSILGCQKTLEAKQVDVHSEINKLHTRLQKNNYLTYIFKLEQDLHDGRSVKLTLQYGENSLEIKRFYKIMDSINSLNLKRIDLYLERFGHPKKDTFSDFALQAPWLVIHHNAKKVFRKKYFKPLFDAYLAGDISENQFDQYLGCTYQIEFGDYPNWEQTVQNEEKINWLITSLKLEDKPR